MDYLKLLKNRRILFVINQHLSTCEQFQHIKAFLELYPDDDAKSNQTSIMAEHVFHNRSFSLTWSVAPVGWWNNTKYLNKKELIPVPYTNMAAISLFWYTNMAAVTSDENDLY
jgi:hypothetical protein